MPVPDREPIPGPLLKQPDKHNVASSTLSSVLSRVKIRYALITLDSADVGTDGGHRISELALWTRPVVFLPFSSCYANHRHNDLRFPPAAIRGQGTSLQILSFRSWTVHHYRYLAPSTCSRATGGPLESLKGKNAADKSSFLPACALRRATVSPFKDSEGGPGPGAIRSLQPCDSAVCVRRLI